MPYACSPLLCIAGLEVEYYINITIDNVDRNNSGKKLTKKQYNLKLYL